MKKFVHFIVMAVFVLLIGCCERAHAGTDPKLNVNTISQAGFDNLSAEQQAQILQQVTQLQPNATSGLDALEATTDKFVNYGERVGKMLGGAAKEVGVAVNDFVKTDVGKMTAAMIIWSYIGKDATRIAVHVGGALLTLIVGMSWIFILLRRSHHYDIKYDPEKTNIFRNSRKISATRGTLSDGEQFGFLMSGGIVIAATIILLVTAV